MNNQLFLGLRKYYPIMFAVGLVVAGLIVFSLLNRFVFFNVVGATKNVSTTTTAYEFTFNKELADINDKDLSGHVTLSEEIEKVVRIEGKKLNIYLERPPSADTEFLISLKDISSKSGSKLSKDFSYFIKYKETANLSEEELRVATERSNSFETDYPLMKKLPLISDRYEITTRFPNSGSNKMPVVIDCLTINPLPTDLQGNSILSNTSDPAVIEYTNEVRTCRNLATPQLKELGFNTERYELLCGEPVLLSEYSCAYDEL